jgi:hypothetical protein
LAISAGAKVIALKKVDFPVFGFPTTPSKREYDFCIDNSIHSLYCCSVLGYIICAFKKEKCLPSCCSYERHFCHAEDYTFDLVFSEVESVIVGSLKSYQITYSVSKAH